MDPKELENKITKKTKVIVPVHMLGVSCEMREIFKSVREKLTSKYLENSSLKNNKKFKPRIKARIRRNKQIISKNINSLFSWIKGDELVELKECNTKEDPVRPELDNTIRTSYGRKIFGVKYNK